MHAYTERRLRLLTKPSFQNIPLILQEFYRKDEEKRVVRSL